MSRFVLITDYDENPSGYGKISIGLGRELMRRGHTVYLYGFEAHTGAPNHMEPFAIIPTTPGMIFSQIEKLRDNIDYIIVACDLTLHGKLLQRLSGDPYVGLFVVEGDNIGHPTELSVVIQQIPYPMVLTRHGQAVCESYELTSHYLPIGIDTSFFRPDPERRIELRKRMGFRDDDKIVLTVADNHERKQHPLNMQAFAQFAQNHDNAYYIVISRLRPVFIGFDIRALARKYGVADKVVVYDQGVPEDRLLGFYQMADAFLLLSCCEGYGMPPLEAMACGLPSVATDTSGLSEQLADGRGYLVRPAYHYTHPLGNSERVFADPNDGTKGLEHVINGPDREKIIQAGLEHARKLTWKASVDALEENLGTKKPTEETEIKPDLATRIESFVKS